MRRWARTLAVLPSLAALAASGNLVATALLVPPTVGAAPSVQAEPELPDRIARQVLASREVTVAWPGSDLVDILLERVPLDPGESVDGRDPNTSGGGEGSAGVLAQRSGLHLLYVERGQIVVGTRDGEAALRQGESAFVPHPTLAEYEEARRSGEMPSYLLRNDSTECAAVLRLSVFFASPGRGARPSAPSGPERGCGEYEQLFYTLTHFPWPESPPEELAVRPLVARLSWRDLPVFMGGERGSVFASGPAAFIVESGTFRFGVGGEGSDPDVKASLGVGNTLQVKAGVPFDGIGDPGTALLLAGVFPVDAPWLVVPPAPGSRSAPPAAPEFPVGTVVATAEDRVNLRAAASTAGDVLGELPRGTELTVTNSPVVDPAGYVWYPVVDANGRAGYVAGQFLERP